MSHFEVYILNYNGAHFLPLCLESLRKVKLNEHTLTVNIEHTLTVNVVDNGSSDRSLELVRESFPEVNIIALPKNYGFSRGNNLGVKIRQEQRKREGKKTDIHVFLNNDTEVNEGWIFEAAKIFSSKPRIGIVGSKSVFLDRFVVLEILTKAPFSPTSYGSGDTRELGIVLRGDVEGKNINLGKGRMKFVHFHPQEGDIRWTKEKSYLYLPVIDSELPLQVAFTLENHHHEKEVVEIEVRVNREETPVFKTALQKHQPQKVELEIPCHKGIDVIQNAGSFVKPNLDAGDRGMYEIDHGQYDTTEEVDAICGVSLFIRDDVFRKAKGFDEGFFAYFEDTDLSLRVRQKGYEIVYCPNSSIRHLHCGSGGGESSSYFNATVMFSHLLFMSKYGDKSQWGKKLSQVKEGARREFSQFQRDYRVDDKPHLRAYCKYLKRFHIFTKNRISGTFNGRWMRQLKNPPRIKNPSLVQSS